MNFNSKIAIYLSPKFENKIACARPKCPQKTGDTDHVKIVILQGQIVLLI